MCSSDLFPSHDSQVEVEDGRQKLDAFVITKARERPEFAHTIKGKSQGG